VGWLAARGLTLVPSARSNLRAKHVVLTTNGFRTRVQFPPGPPLTALTAVTKNATLAKAKVAFL
jgi:hypothetical protein